MNEYSLAKVQLYLFLVLMPMVYKSICLISPDKYANLAIYVSLFISIITFCDKITNIIWIIKQKVLILQLGNEYSKKSSP